MIDCSDISVIIPVHNGGKNFINCLNSLVTSCSQYREVIVVVDGDSDGSWQRAHTVGARVIRLPETGGPAQARNVGAQIASGAILFFMDADVCLHPETLPKVAIAFDADPDLAALIGSYDNQPGAPNFLSQYRNLLHHFTHQTGASSANTFWGACGAIRREIFLSIGGFDIAYRRPTIEDIELGYRLKASGFRIGLFKDIQVKHLKRWGVRSLLKADFFYRALPWTELILREQRLDNDLNLSLTSRLSVILSFGLLGSLSFGIFSGLLGWNLTAVLGLTTAMQISLMLWLNTPFYQFLHRERDLWFMLQALPWHWLYFFYSGLAFIVGSLRFWMRRQKCSASAVFSKILPSN